MFVGSRLAFKQPERFQSNPNQIRDKNGLGVEKDEQHQHEKGDSEV